MRKVSTLDQSIDEVLRSVRVQKNASAPKATPEEIADNSLRKLATTLRKTEDTPLSYQDLHDVKSGTYDTGPIPTPSAKLASTGTSSELRKLAYGLRIAHHLKRMRTVKEAQLTIKAAEGLILLQQRRGR